MNILIAALTIVNARAAAPDLDSIWKLGAQKNLCDVYKDNYGDYQPPDFKKTLPAEGAREALRTLESLRPADPADLARVRVALGADFAGSVLRWIPVAGSDCPVTRLYLGRAVLKSAGPSPEIKARLTAIMKRPRYPTYLNAMIDVIVMEAGLDGGFWMRDERLRADVKAQRTKIKTEITRFEKASSTVLNETHLGEEPTSPPLEAQLRAHPKLPAVKAAILREYDFARGISSENLALIERLK